MYVSSWLFILIVCSNGEECQCKPIGKSVTEGFTPNTCTTKTTESRSFCFNSDFVFGPMLVYNETLSSNTILLTSNYSFTHFNYYMILNNAIVTYVGFFHTVNMTVIGINSVNNVNSYFSVAGSLEVKNPLLNYPQILLWNSTYLHLNRNITDRVDFQILNPVNNKKCFDVISLNSPNNLNINLVANNCILSSMFPYIFMEGLGYLISNQRLIRFCPNGVELVKTVTCTLILNSYSNSSYIPNYSPQTFNFPHCPCNSDLSVICELKLSEQYNSYDFQTKSLDNTNLYVDKNVLLSNLNCPKIVTISDNVKVDFYGRVYGTVFSYSFGEIRFDSTQIPFVTPYSVIFNSTMNTFYFGHNMNFAVNFTKIIRNFVINSSSEISSLYLQPNSLIFVFGALSIHNIVPVDFGVFDISHVVMKSETTNNSCLLVETTQTKNTCLLCNFEYRLVDGKCVSKAINCASYNENNVCVLCLDGYVLDNNYNCIKSGKCEIGTTSNCYKCVDLYIKENTSCVYNNKCIYGDGNVCVKCESGESDSNCENCGDTQCLNCNNNNCKLCQAGSVINDTGKCEEEKNGKSYGISTIYCNSGFYTENSKCENCFTKHENSVLCNYEYSIKCDKNFILTENGNCITKICKVNETNEGNGNCVIPIDNCLHIVKNKCVECGNGFVLNEQFMCEKNENLYPIKNCEQNGKSGCKRCDLGYFVSSGICMKCSENCTSCIETSTKCLSCENGYYQGDNYKCVSNDKLTEKCNKISAVTNGCYQCKNNYYRVGMDCLPCLLNCSMCNIKDKCLTCNATNYKNKDGLCLPQNSIEGCAVQITQSGCSKCQDGYFTSNLYECEKCNENCTQCTFLNTCTSCKHNKILSENGLCLDIYSIKKCTEVSNSKCSKCAFWYLPTNDGILCKKKVVWWVVLIVVIFIVVIVVILIILIYFIVSKIQQKMRQKEIAMTTTLFKMRHSNINFVALGDGIVVNKTEIDFGTEIEANVKHRELLCVGNTTKHNMKIQITTKSEKITKYIFEAQPTIVVLGENNACEFEIMIDIKCTTKLNESLMLVANSFDSDKDVIKEIKFYAQTKLSTRLDPDELIEEKKLGEGSFGIVFKGLFRGYEVAIKKMKTCVSSEDALDEFEKEVAMLDKFRSDYIVHFYGAVFVVNNICMVTEFALYGSLYDLMKHKKDEEIDIKTRVKILLDASKGILYLHENGILHRDIKPDNILVFSLNVNDKVNAKLTDFGSSRNVNLLMTNMTFTKGIGTPVYMAPEVLKQEKYTKSADVYSFGITMFECLLWEEAYPKTLFPFTWCIADKVVLGIRPTAVKKLEMKYQNIIKSCWEQIPEKRCTIDNTITMIETLI
ncbi:protein serine/threonine kinase, putative [Entamoeba invadens IP1]|uniref:Protein serine/threonine kinase, putative n=1 Tax=Entamoeba invadens IP1 TaxID=370355 RepID=A0A0A1TW92_ENTIV|nr:protein serine/threonine kinase, putative [Entamoeba invadens IP1]ELP84798.1 protein serine/threonine kinase, putative [Entamoeba invadens IP1]|eukprot:XP_004184144.1 protein serine/threonine kinase, putative [Entamoeba invadens IP1]